MLKVVVFGNGWGGEIFADRLEKAVGVIEVVREIDWARGNYCQYGKRRIRELVESLLAKHIGRADLIVLASYTVSQAALVYLSEKYPEQKFMGLKPALARKLNEAVEDENLQQELVEYKRQLGLKRKIQFAWYGYGRAGVMETLGEIVGKGRKKVVLVLASDAVKGSREYKEERRSLEKKYRLVEPSCEAWAQRIDDGLEGIGEMVWKLPAEQEVKAVLIYGTTFMRARDALEKMYGWRVKIYDDFQKSMRDVCKILHMKGACEV